jgi:hypothetical protein
MGNDSRIGALIQGSRELDEALRDTLTKCSKIRTRNASETE